MGNKKLKVPLSSILVALANGESTASDIQAQRNAPSNEANAFGSNAVHRKNSGRDDLQRINDHKGPRAPMDVVKFTDNNDSVAGANAKDDKSKNGKTSNQAPFASPLLSKYPRRQSRDHVTVPILAQNVVFEERPRVIKSLAHLDDPFPTLEQQIAQRRAQEEESKRQKASEAECEARKSKEESSARILGARIIHEQPINFVTGRTSGQWGRQLQAQANRSTQGNQEDEALLAVLANSNINIDHLPSPDHIFERTQQYKRNHVYEKLGQKKEQPSMVVRSLEEVQQARTEGHKDSLGPSFLGQSAKALLRAQNNPRAMRDSANDSLGVETVDPLRALPMFDGKATMNVNKQDRNISPKDCLISGEAKLLVEYFSPFIQVDDLVFTDVRAQLERVPFIAVRTKPQGNMIVGILCEDSYEEMRDNPRLILSYSAKLQRYRQRLAEDISNYLRMSESQALMLFDSMTGFICLERLDVNQVRRLIQFYSTHRVVKERRSLIRLFTNQDEHTRILCPVEGMYQQCHEYLQQNFLRQETVVDAQDSNNASNKAAQSTSFFSSSLANKGINLTEAFRDFLQLQDDDGKESQREILRQLQEYLKEVDVVDPVSKQSEADLGEIWFAKCHDLPPLQAHGEATDIFALLVQNYDQNKILPMHLDWKRIVNLCQHLNQSYQPLKRAVNVYVPKLELLLDPAAIHRSIRDVANRQDVNLDTSTENMALSRSQTKHVQRVSIEVDAKADELIEPPQNKIPQTHTPVMERLVANATVPTSKQGQFSNNANTKNHHGNKDHQINGVPIDRAAIAAYRARAESSAVDASIPQIAFSDVDAQDVLKGQHAAHIQARQVLMQLQTQSQQQKQQIVRSPQQAYVNNADIAPVNQQVRSKRNKALQLKPQCSARYGQASQGNQKQESSALRPDPRASGYSPESTSTQGQVRFREGERAMRSMPRQGRSLEPQQELRMPRAMRSASSRAQSMPLRQQDRSYRQSQPPMSDDNYDVYDEQSIPPRQADHTNDPLPVQQERAMLAKNVSKVPNQPSYANKVAGNNYLIQSLAVPENSYAQQQSRYQEAVVLGRNVSAPQILDTPYNNYVEDVAKSVEDSDGDDDSYRMDFSLNPLGGRGSNVVTDLVQEQRAGQKQSRRVSTLTSVSVADVDFVPVTASDQNFNDFDNDVDGIGEQMQWQGSLSIDFATPSLGGGYNPQQIARNISQAQAQARTQSQEQTSLKQLQPQQSQTAVFVSASNDEAQEINALVQAALEAEKN